MSDSIEILPSKDETVKRLFALIGSHKREGRLRAATEVTLFGTYWDGGSRSEYAAVRLSDMKADRSPQFDPPQFGGPTSAPVVPLKPGYVIISHGVFCGKPATPTVYVHPSDMPFFLPKPPSLG